MCAGGEGGEGGEGGVLSFCMAPRLWSPSPEDLGVLFPPVICFCRHL